MNRSSIGHLPNTIGSVRPKTMGSVRGSSIWALETRPATLGTAVTTCVRCPLFRFGLTCNLL